MEFLVEFELDIPDSVPKSEIEAREKSEAGAAETLADQGHLVRLWRASVDTGPTRVLGLYRAGSRAELDALLGALHAVRMDANLHYATHSSPERPGGDRSERVMFQLQRAAPRRRTSPNMSA